LLTDFPIDLAFFDLPGVVTSRPVLGDVDNDGKPDIVAGLPDGGVYAYNYRADLISGFPLASSFEIEKTCAVGDIDDDGDVDLLVTEGSGAIDAWDVSSAYSPANNPWTCSGGNVFGMSYLPPEFQKAVVQNDSQLPSESVFNYPNPASNSTTIRFYLNSDSQVNIEIFDFMGERIKSASMQGTAHSDNEYVWDCSDIASGVYFCRVEADNGSGKEWRMIKIALVK